MVKGISRQVIVVKSPDPKLFEQAIFILKDDAIGTDGITDEQLLKEAQKIIRGSNRIPKQKWRYFGPAWACCGAAITGFVWLISSLL